MVSFRPKSKRKGAFAVKLDAPQREQFVFVCRPKMNDD
jgi:hypothetical protein